MLVSYTHHKHSSLDNPMEQEHRSVDRYLMFPPSRTFYYDSLSFYSFFLSFEFVLESLFASRFNLNSIGTVIFICQCHTLCSDRKKNQKAFRILGSQYVEKNGSKRLCYSIHCRNHKKCSVMNPMKLQRTRNQSTSYLLTTFKRYICNSIVCIFTIPSFARARIRFSL